MIWFLGEVFINGYVSREAAGSVSVSQSLGWKRALIKLSWLMLFQRGLKPALVFSQTVSQQCLRGLNWHCQQWRCFSESLRTPVNKRWCLKGLVHVSSPVWETNVFLMQVMFGLCRPFLCSLLSCQYEIRTDGIFSYYTVRVWKC